MLQVIPQMHRANTCQESMDRLYHVDNAKAIGMILIIWSHVWVTGEMAASCMFEFWNMMLNSFYVPLFFVLSGIFEPSDVDYQHYFRRLVRLLKYCVLFSIFGIVVIGLIDGKWSVSSWRIGTTIWFIVTLLWITIIFGCIKNLATVIIVAINVVSSIIGYYLARRGHSYVYIGQAMLCMPFYTVGYLFKRWFRNPAFRKDVMLISAVVWIFVTMCFSVAVQNIALNMICQPFVSFYVSAFAGSVMLIEASKALKCRYLSWYGRNTIVLMLVQLAFCKLIGRQFIVSGWCEYVGVAVLVVVLSGICIPIFRNKYFDVFT